MDSWDPGVLKFFLELLGGNSEVQIVCSPPGSLEVIVPCSYDYLFLIDPAADHLARIRRTSDRYCFDIALVGVDDV